MSDFLEGAKIVVFSMLAAIVYGLLHDQVTAHLCVEYFSIAHPPVFPTSSPFLLALGWGVIATWWVGLPLGLGLAAVARLGPPPRLALVDLRGAVLSLMVVSAICAIVTGAIAAYLVARGRTDLLDGWDAVIAPAKQVAFAADLWAHRASYLAGVFGGIVVIGVTLWRRVRAARTSAEVAAR
jgi:hypothetical protein